MFSGLRMGLVQEERCEALKVVVQSLLVVGPEVYALVSCARGTQPPGELLLASCAIPKTSTRERKPTNTSDWMLKSKAITDHGGGQAGEAAIDEAVAAGIYEERVVFKGKDKFGKPLQISQIRVNSEKSDQMHSTGLTEKARVGAVADQDVFK